MCICECNRGELGVVPYSIPSLFNSAAIRRWCHKMRASWPGGSRLFCVLSTRQHDEQRRDFGSLRRPHLQRDGFMPSYVSSSTARSTPPDPAPAELGQRLPTPANWSSPHSPASVPRAGELSRGRGLGRSGCRGGRCSLSLVHHLRCPATIADCGHTGFLVINGRNIFVDAPFPLLCVFSKWPQRLPHPFILPFRVGDLLAETADQFYGFRPISFHYLHRLIADGRLWRCRFRAADGFNIVWHVSPPIYQSALRAVCNRVHLGHIHACEYTDVRLPFGRCTPP